MESKAPNGLSQFSSIPGMNECLISSLSGFCLLSWLSVVLPSLSFRCFQSFTSPNVTNVLLFTDIGNRHCRIFFRLYDHLYIDFKLSVNYVLILLPHINFIK